MPYTTKQNKYIVDSTHRWNFKTGAVRSGKSFVDVTAIIPMRIRERIGKDGLCFIIGVSKETIERNVLQPMRERYTSAVVGTINSRNIARICGEDVYCLGAEKVSQVAKIQGASAKYIYGDEVAKWNEEVFSMLKSRLDKTYSCFDGSLNPEHPTHWLKKFLDSDADIYCQKYTIFDNTYLSPEFVKNLCSEYEGTIYYNRLILGEWVRAEGAIYRKFADNPKKFSCEIVSELTSDNKKQFLFSELCDITMGIDFGGNKSGHSFTATARTKDYQHLIALKSERHFGDYDSNDIDALALDFAQSVMDLYGKLDFLYWDNAETVLGRGIKRAFGSRFPSVIVRPARKYAINDRINTLLRLMGAGRFYMTDDCDTLKTALCEVVWNDKAELESVCGLGSVTGLCGANCYHSYSPVIPGISKPTYTAEELAQMNAEEMKQIKYGDKKYTKYEALQRQRKLENTMRAQRQKIKLLEDGGANEDDIITARCRYRATSAEYTRFSKAMNLPQQRERVYIDGLGNVGAGKYTKTQTYLAQYKRYKERLGAAAPSSYDEFEKLRFSKSKEWENMQLQYRYKGIDDRLLSHIPSYQVLRITDGVPDAYNDCARAIDERSKEVIFKYTDGGSGCAEINTFAATGKATTAASAQNVQDLHDALAQMSLPQDTVVFRGTKRAYIEGLDELEGKVELSDWLDRPVKIKSFASTSLFRDTMYEGEVEMTILVPKGKKGAGYVNEISHHHLTADFEDEYEVVLQNNSEYGIIGAQYYKDKLFLVVEWLGGR